MRVKVGRRGEKKEIKLQRPDPKFQVRKTNKNLLKRKNESPGPVCN